MTLNQVKLFAIAIIALPVFFVFIFNINSVNAVSESVKVEDVAETYKAKCALCHKPNAEKFFDAAKTDDVLVDIILKGKKADKPPHMPGYQEKGMTTDQAKVLVEYMRKLRTPAGE